MYFPQISSCSCKNLWRSFYDVPRYTKDGCLSCFLSLSPLTRKQKRMIPEPSELERPFLLTSSNDFSFSPLTLTLTHTYPCFIPISCNTLPHSLSQQHDNLQTNLSLPIIMSKSPHHTNPPSSANITSFPTEGYDVRHPPNLMHCSTPHWQNHWLQRLLIWKCVLCIWIYSVSAVTTTINDGASPRKHQTWWQNVAQPQLQDVTSQVLQLYGSWAGPLLLGCHLHL